LGTGNFSEESWLEKEGFTAVPNKFYGIDIVLGRMRRNVSKHLPDLT
jgi:hypothetical protein